VSIPVELIDDELYDSARKIARGVVVRLLSQGFTRDQIRPAVVKSALQAIERTRGPLPDWQAETYCAVAARAVDDMLAADEAEIASVQAALDEATARYGGKEGRL